MWMEKAGQDEESNTGPPAIKFVRFMIKSRSFRPSWIYSAASGVPVASWRWRHCFRKLAGVCHQGKFVEKFAIPLVAERRPRAERRDARWIDAIVPNVAS